MKASRLFHTGDCGTGCYCYYCGGECDDRYGTQEYVKDTFTNRDEVLRPGSPHVCAACVESLSSDVSVTLLDGENRDHTWVRLYSWVITKSERRAATKKHIVELRGFVLDPPEPPFAIVLSDSGQKQLLFRAPVAISRDVYPVTLETERILVVPELLRHRLHLATRAAAAIGKPGLLECETTGCYIACQEYYGTTDPLEQWVEVYREPLSRLAAWLAPAREEARREYPRTECGGVPAENRRTGGPGQGNGPRRQGSADGGGSQLGLDFSEFVR